MAFITEQCDCVVCGNEADLVVDCKLLEIKDTNHINVLPKDPDIQVMPGMP